MFQPSIWTSRYLRNENNYKRDGERDGGHNIYSSTDKCFKIPPFPEKLKYGETYFLAMKNM